MSKTKASDYFTAGIILMALAGILWLVESFVLNEKADNIIVLVIPFIFVVFSAAHLDIAGSKLYSSR